MITTPIDVKTLCRLFSQGDSFSNDTFIDAIFNAENSIIPFIKKRHLVPLQPIEFFQGNISCDVSNNLISGINTNFLSKFEVGNYITFSNGSTNLQTYQIKNINSDTQIEINQNALTTLNNLKYYKMPSEIVTAIKFQAARFLFLNYFSEMAYNQESDRFSTQYDSIAKNLIKLFADGEYYCSDLLPAQATDTPARKFKSYRNANNDNFLFKVNNFI